MADRRAARPARCSGLLHSRRHRDAVRNGVEGARELRPNRGAVGRASTGMGPARRGRGRPAPIEHPRQRVCGRHHRLHRRHADRARTRRAESRRVRLPGNHRRSRVLENRPGPPRRHRPIRADRRATQTCERHEYRGDPEADGSGVVPAARRRRSPRSDDPTGRRSQPPRRVRRERARSHASPADRSPHGRHHRRVELDDGVIGVNTDRRAGSRHSLVADRLRP